MSKCSNKNLGSNKNSKTLWQDREANYPPKSKKNIPRLDMEGEDIHIHIGNKAEKFRYSKITGTFKNSEGIKIPSSLEKKLSKDSSFQKALKKGIEGV